MSTYCVYVEGEENIQNGGSERERDRTESSGKMGFHLFSYCFFLPWASSVYKDWHMILLTCRSGQEIHSTVPSQSLGAKCHTIEPKPNLDIWKAI